MRIAFNFCKHAMVVCFAKLLEDELCCVEEKNTENNKTIIELGSRKIVIWLCLSAFSASIICSTSSNNDNDIMQ